VKIRPRLPPGVPAIAGLLVLGVLVLGLLGLRAARAPAPAVREAAPALLSPAAPRGDVRPPAPSRPPASARAVAAPEAGRREPLRLVEARARAAAGEPSVIEVSFDGPVDPGATPRLEDHFSVVPPAAFRARAAGPTVTLEGAFEPGRRYRVVARRGLRAAGGAALAADAAREVRIPDLAPALGFPGALALSPRGRPAIPLEAVNIDALGARAVRIAHGDLARLWAAGGAAQAPGGPPPRAHALPPAPNRVRSLGLRLDDIAGPDPRGAWRIEAFASSGGKSLFAEEIALVTDIAITAVEHPAGTMVWATSMADGAPIEGADVEIVSRSLERIAEGRTGAGGLAFLRAAPGQDAAFVLARKGPDVSLLEICGRPGGTAVEGGSAPRGAFVFTDRAACAPGGTIRIHAWTRGLDGGLPPGSRIELSAVRPDGEPLGAVDAALDARGSAAASIRVPVTAQAGAWRAEARAGSGGEPARLLGACAFHVEDGPRRGAAVEIGLGIRPETARALRPGEELEVIATGTSAAGLPAGGTRAAARWWIAPRADPLAAWRRFSFGEAGAWDGSWGPEDVEALLDESGEARLRIAVPELEAALPLEIRLAAFARRPAPGLERDVLAVPIDPAPVYLGLRLEGEAPRGGTRPARFECIAVRPDGRLAGLEAVDLQLMRVRWRAAPRRAGRAIRHESRDEVEEVGRRRLALSGGRGGFEVDLEDEGFHRIRIKDPASHAAAELTVHAAAGASGFTVAPLDGPGRLRLELRKAAVRPGEAAILRVISPFEGTLLLVTETDRIEAAAVTRIGAGAQDIEVRVPPRPAGPVRFMALAAGAPGAGESVPRRAFARIAAPLEPGALRLAVTVSAPATAPAASRVRARAVVASEDGRPVAGAIVALGIVDPVERRLGARPPDPASFFQEEPARGFRIEDAVSLDISTDSLRGEPAAGASDGPLAPGNERAASLRPRAAPLGPFVTGEDGTIVVDADMPPRAGEALLFAIASAGPLAGSGERPIHIRPARRLDAKWPAYLAAGDTFELPVDAGEGVSPAETSGYRWSLDGLVEAPIETVAPGVGSWGIGVRFASLRDGGRGPASTGSAFGLRARWRSGIASATLATGAGAGEASVSARIPVRPRALAERRRETGVIDASRPLERAAREGALPGSHRYRLIVSSDPLVHLAPSVDSLLEREPLALEEWTCRGLALLHLGGIAGALLEGGDAGAPRREIRAAIEAVAGLRAAGGLLSSVPGGRAPPLPAALAAALFLADARAAGHAVPDDTLGALLDAIASSILAAPWRSGADDALARARALHALSVAGRADPEALESLRTRLSLSELEASGPARIEAGAHLAAALAASGRTEEALTLIDEAVLPGAAGPDAGPRDAAVALIALARAGAPADDARAALLVETLLERRERGLWRTIDETAIAISAIGRHAAAALLAPRWVAAAPGSDLRGEVRAGSGPAAPVIPGRIAVLSGEWPDGPVRAAVSGVGALRYAWLEEWAPAAADAPGSTHGLRVTRRLLDRKLEPIDPAAVRRGDIVVIEIALAVEGDRARRSEDRPARAIATDRPACGLEVEDLAPGDLASEDSLPLERAVLRGGEAVFVLSLEDAAGGVHRYVARAVLRGEFGMGPLEGRLLEEPAVRGATAPGTIRIR
jgi:uncharacterized protein YfaS (alpha-2-macroglobulin family)